MAAAASKAWGDLLRGKGELDIMSRMHAFFLRRHYAYACFYWHWLLIDSKKLLLLDTIRKMEFSMGDLPPGEWSRKGLAFVEAGEGMPGMFGFRGRTASDLSYAIARNKGEDPTQWQMEKKISLDSGYNYFIKDSSERYLLLRRIEASYSKNRLTEHFSMDIKTLKLQRVCAIEGIDMYLDRIYTNYPPSLLSLPTI